MFESVLNDPIGSSKPSLRIAILIAVVQYMGNGPLLVYALGVMLLTLIWAGVSGGLSSVSTRDVTAISR